MAEKWIQGAIKKPGAFTAQAKRADTTPAGLAAKVKSNPKDYSPTTRKRAALSRTLASMRAEGK